MFGPHNHARRAGPRNLLLKLPLPLYDSMKWCLLLALRLLISIEDGPLVLRNLCVVCALHVLIPGFITGEGGPLCQLASHERLRAVGVESNPDEPRRLDARSPFRHE